MIPTLGRGLLYQVHRRKPELLRAMEKRRTFWLSLWIVVALAIAAYFFTR